MFRSLIVLAALTALGSPLSAAMLSGRTLDLETRNPLRDVNVRILDLDRVIASDRHGEFILTNIDSGTYRLVATHVGYDVTDTMLVNTADERKVELLLRPMPWVLNSVVVTGTRSPHLLKDVPVQTEVVTKRDFYRTGAKTVGDALSNAIGTNINEDLSGQGATIRGIEGDRVLVLVDGERAVGRVRGSIDLGQFALNNVQRIEVVKGTGSTLYGSDAMGGVINIITNNPSQTSHYANLYADYGTFNTANPSAELAWGNSKVAFTTGGRLFKTDGFDLDERTLHTNGQEDIRRLNLDGKVRWATGGRWNLTASGRYMDEKKLWIETETNETFVYDNDETNKRYDGSLTLDYLSGERYSAKLRLYGTYYDHQWDKLRNSSGFLVDRSKTEDVFYEAAYHSNYVIGQNHVATYGFDFNYQDLKSSELSVAPDADQAWDAYFQYEYSPQRSWVFLPGVRYEDHSAFGSKVNPSLNVMYRRSESFKLRGFVGYGFRAPSLKQQYFLFDHLAAGYVVYGSKIDFPFQLPPGKTLTDLTAENSINSSLTAEFSYGSIGLHRLTYFYNHLQDLIDFDLMGFYGNYWRGVYVYQNVGTAITQGIEWESRVRMSEAVDFSLAYNYLYSRNLSRGEKLVNRPDHTLKFSLTGQLGKTGLGATFWGTYQSRKLWVPRSNTGGNEGDPIYAPHWTRLNLNFFKRWPNGFETFFRLENLLDETNMSYGYWPGFQVFVGLKYDINFK